MRLLLRMGLKLGHLALANMSNLLLREHLAKTGEKLPYKAPTPLSSNYCPEIDVSPELGDIKASHFHSLIGVLR